MRNFLFLVLPLFLGTPARAAFTENIQIANSYRRSFSDVETFKSQVGLACRKIFRASYALSYYWNEIRTHMGSRGANFPVLYANRDFYESRIYQRVAACFWKPLYYRFVGRCSTEQGTWAYVRVIFGFVQKTVNICDEFFELSPARQVTVLLHEFGRLEGIGDSSNFDTDNIYVWGAIVGVLSDEKTIESLYRIADARGRFVKWKKTGN